MANVKGKFNIKNLHIRKDGTLSGKAKYFIVTIDSGGKVLGELGLTKAPRVVTSSANKKIIIIIKILIILTLLMEVDNSLSE